MSIRHGVYIQEEATAVQVPKTGNSSVQVVVGTAPVNMAENPSEAVNVPILANSGTEAMAALGYSVDFKNFTLCQTMFATSNLFQVSRLHQRPGSGKAQQGTRRGRVPGKPEAGSDRERRHHPRRAHRQEFNRRYRAQGWRGLQCCI